MQKGKTTKIRASSIGAAPWSDVSDLSLDRFD